MLVLELNIIEIYNILSSFSKYLDICFEKSINQNWCCPFHSLKTSYADNTVMKAAIPAHFFLSQRYPVCSNSSCVSSLAQNDLGWRADSFPFKSLQKILGRKSAHLFCSSREAWFISTEKVFMHCAELC